jgi:sugar/nucleoside kinase (ribokinase family)
VVRGVAQAAARAPKVKLVSPLGAGDAFLGGLVAGLDRAGWVPERAPEALPGALAAAVRACERWGALD